MDELRFFIWLIIVGLPGLILWLIMLSILSHKGINVNYFIVSITDYKSFLKVTKEETSKRYKSKLFFIFWAQIALIVIYIVGVIIL